MASNIDKKNKESIMVDTSRTPTGNKPQIRLLVFTTVMSIALTVASTTPVFAAQKYWSYSNCGTSWWDYNCWSATPGGALDGTAQPITGDQVFLINPTSSNSPSLSRSA